MADPEFEFVSLRPSKPDKRGWGDSDVNTYTMSIPHPTKAHGAETRTNTVWELYNEKAKIRDNALQKDWESSINSLLLFAAIFAAVLTALCIESRKLLEADPLTSIEQTLLFVAQRLGDPSSPAPPPRQPFEPPGWAVTVNGFFFTSLTTSILAAVGSVTCLQWVGEYDAGLEAASTPETRALQCHYRYRAIDQWYMRHMIASLAIILYVSVGFFLVGLSMWFWHLRPTLASIPMTGLFVWATGYISTTLMAVFYSSAPYRTALSKALFRVNSLATFYVRKHTQIVIVLYRPLLKSLRHSFDGNNEYKDQFLLEKMEVSRQLDSDLLAYYPWMPPGHDFQSSMHSYVWEQGCVAQDDTIHLATLAWLITQLDLSEHSIPNFHLLLEELNKLPDNKLREWSAYNHNVPWSHIFNLVVAPSSQTEALYLALHRDKIIPTLAQLLQKMTLHPFLFERMIHDLDHGLLVAFMRRLASEPPNDKDVAHARLESITSLLASEKWAGMSTEEQPVMHVFKIILDCLDCLDMLQATNSAQDMSTSWIFTLCHVDETKHHAGVTRSWPNPELIRLIPDAFRNQDLREHAIRHLLQFIDGVLSGNERVIETGRRWRWRRDVESTTDDQLIAIKLLVTHILPIFLILDDTYGRQRSQGMFNQILGSNEISSPALRLVLVGFGGHRNSMILPLESDAIWQDQVWGYAIAAWYGFHSVHSPPSGREASESTLVEQSTSTITRIRNANPVALDSLIRLSEESPSSPMFWIGLFRSIRGSDAEFQNFASQTVQLQPEQWLRLFTYFHAIERSDASSPVTKAMLRTLRESIQSALLQLQWRATAPAAAHDQDLTNGSLPPTPIARFIHAAHEVLRREWPYRQSRVPLPFGMLLHIRDILLADQSDMDDPTFEQLQACVSAVDELALAYASGNWRDQNYSRLFLEIVQALRPIRAHFMVPPGGLQSIEAKDGLSNDALSWPVSFQAALDHASHAGGIRRTDTSVSLNLVTAPGPSNGNVAMKNTSQDGVVRETLFRRGLGRLVSHTKSNDYSV